MTNDCQFTHKPSNTDHGLSPSRGFSILEVLVAMSILGVLFVTIVPILGWAAEQRHNADQRQFALQEVSNLMEHASLQPWDKLTQESLAHVPLSSEAQNVLKNAQLEIRAIDHADTPPAKQVTITLRWKDRTGTFVRPVRLTTWFFRQKEAD